MSSDTLYYDGQCPLCSAEMDELKKHADSNLEFVDIHSLSEKDNLPTKQVLLGNCIFCSGASEWI